LVSIFDPSVSIPFVLASEETFLDCEIGGGKLILLPDKGTTIGSFGIATPFIKSI